MKTTRCLLIIFLAVLSACSNTKKYSEAEKYVLNNAAYTNLNNRVKVSEEEVKRNIENEKFDEMELLVAKAKADFNRDISFEWEFLSAYESIIPINTVSSLSYDADIKHFNHWIEQKKSPPSYAFRGMYYSGIAYKYRGTGFISKVSKSDLQNAEKYWALAISDFETALEMDQSLLPVYIAMIKIKASQGVSLDEIVNQALRNIPQSYYIRQNYIEYLQPKWGYSYNTAQQFIDESQIYAEKNYRIWGLRGIPYAAKAYNCLVTDENYDCAIKNYNNALQYGIKSSWLSYLAYSYYLKQDYHSSLINIKKMADYLPDNKDIEYLINALEIEISNASLPEGTRKQPPITALGLSDFSKDW